MDPGSSPAPLDNFFLRWCQPSDLLFGGIPTAREDSQGWRCGAEDEHRRFPDLDRQAGQARALAVASAPAADGLPRLVALPGPRTATRRVPIERLDTGAYCSFCQERPLESAGAACAEQIGYPPGAFPELTVSGWPGYGPITTILHDRCPDRPAEQSPSSTGRPG